MEALIGQSDKYIQLTPGAQIPLAAVKLLIEKLSEIVPDTETYENSKQVTDDLARITKLAVGAYLGTEALGSLVKALAGSIGGGTLALAGGGTISVGSTISIEALAAYAESLGISAAIVLDGVTGGNGGSTSGSGGAGSNSGGNFDMVKDNYLKQRGFDAHKIKKEIIGDSASASEYDIFVDKNTRELYVFRKGGIGQGEATGYILD